MFRNAYIIGLIGSIVGLLFSAFLTTSLMGDTLIAGVLSLLGFIASLIAVLNIPKAPRTIGKLLIVFGIISGLLSPNFTAVGLVAGILVGISGVLVLKETKKHNAAEIETNSSLKSLFKYWWEANKKE
ncbi:hypothetical protein TthWC1_2362 [Thermoanaerobacter thermohydrosulfuricus WC1]|uniref:Uncharacterized protein n=1 Tax=Thermoanaerobacter thermohydrosulfuricus WC1 TaxID=1198630 RepID=M8DDL6_THETY|nr:hypothetical protein [Thermoanaerobacter thermohydrosulfuricus]EMT38132.1 hypothetical protein TthWC1_2362 [Thermoanaerobacter thermohydrosulfuricus WC1]